MRVAQAFGIPRGQRGDFELLQQAARAQRGVKLPGRPGAGSAAPGFQALLEGWGDVNVEEQLAGGNAGQPAFQVGVGALGQVNLALCHAEPGQAAAVARALVKGRAA